MASSTITQVSTSKLNHVRVTASPPGDGEIKPSKTEEETFASTKPASVSDDELSISSQSEVSDSDDESISTDSHGIDSAVLKSTSTRSSGVKGSHFRFMALICTILCINRPSVGCEVDFLRAPWLLRLV